MLQFSKVNYISVTVAAIITWVLGALLYSPLLLGGIWVAGNYVQDPLLYPIIAPAFVLLADLVIATIIASLCGALGVNNFKDAFLISIWIGLGLLSLSMISGYLFLAISWQSAAINVLYIYTKILIFCLFATLWRKKPA